MLNGVSSFFPGQLSAADAFGFPYRFIARRKTKPLQAGQLRESWFFGLQWRSADAWPEKLWAIDSHGSGNRAGRNGSLQPLWGEVLGLTGAEKSLRLCRVGRF